MVRLQLALASRAISKVLDAAFPSRVLSLALLVALIASAVLAVRPSIGEAPPPVLSTSPLDNAAASSVSNTDVNPYGANFFLEWEPEVWKIEKSYQMAREAGIGWVKQQFPWEDLQLSPGPDGFWDERLNKSTWEKYDRIVDLALKHNLQVIARLDRPPKWARQDNTLPQAPPDRYEDFGDFVAAVVTHYKGRVYHYQIWNEPNVFPEWGNRSPDPAAYVRLLSIANVRAKEVDANVWILSAPLAQTLERSDRNLSDVDYLEGMYAAGAQPHFDILFANAYGFAFPPEDEPDRAKLNFARVVLLREVMEANSDSQKAVWFNEFGWNAAPDDFAPTKLPWSRVSEQLQADYTVRAIQMARAKWPWSGVFNIWYFRQSGHLAADRADYYFRMVDIGFAPRQVYTAVKRAAENVGVAKPGSYEETNPAAVFAGHWQAARDDSASAAAYRSTGATGDSLTVAFQGREFALLVRGGPDTGSLLATVDGRESNLLPRDRQGRSYIELAALPKGTSQWVRVADRLSGDSHVVRFVVAPAARPDLATPVGIDGFRVVDQGGIDVAGYWPGALAVLLVVAGALWLRLRRIGRG